MYNIISTSLFLLVSSYYFHNGPRKMSSSSLPLRRFHEVKEAMAQVCSDDERCDHPVWWKGGVGESFFVTFEI